ncbi:hypothetical protein ACH9EU_00875 [Kocuria sp. M1R5S2]|uniref:hypothetical protein n=1 Tax=Kocuria rhizosphaerae TaxID=3376285 RepID=UPI0037949A62
MGDDELRIAEELQATGTFWTEAHGISPMMAGVALGEAGGVRRFRLAGFACCIGAAPWRTSRTDDLRYAGTSVAR